MTRKERHRARLQMLIDEAGTQVKVAESIGSSENYISQLLTKRPSIHRKYCERLEQAWDKPDGWMDQWLPEEALVTLVDRRLTHQEGLLLQGFRKLDAGEQVRLLGWVETESAVRRTPTGEVVATRVHEEPTRY